MANGVAEARPNVNIKVIESSLEFIFIAVNCQLNKPPWVNIRINRYISTHYNLQRLSVNNYQVRLICFN